MARMRDDEIARFLQTAKQSGGALKLVVLRDVDAPADVTSSRDYEALRDDYSMMLMDLETVDGEKKELTDEVTSLKQLVADLHSENNSLKATLGQRSNHVSSCYFGATAFEVESLAVDIAVDHAVLCSDCDGIA